MLVIDIYLSGCAGKALDECHAGHCGDGRSVVVDFAS